MTCSSCGCVYIGDLYLECIECGALYCDECMPVGDYDCRMWVYRIFRNLKNGG